MKVDGDWIIRNTKVEVSTAKYVIARYQHEEGIWCRTCGMLSFNVTDAVNRYCGHCHVFHDEPFPTQAQAEIDDVTVHLYLPPTGSDKPSVLTVAGEKFLIDAGPDVTSMRDANGAVVFTVPTGCSLPEAVAAAKAYLKGRG